MSTLIRKTGLTGNVLRYQARGSATLSDGSAVLVVSDTNAAGSFNSTYGDRTGTEKLYVYHSTDRSSWALRNTINAPLSGGRYTINVSENDTLGIVYWTTTAVRYIAINTSTWVASAAETVRAAVGGTSTENDFDLTYTSGNVPVIVVLRGATSGSSRLQLFGYVRNTSNAWVTSGSLATLETTATPKTAFQAISGAALTGGSPTARPIAIAFGHGTGTTDRGIKLYTALVNETTGVWSSVSHRKTYAVGEVPGAATGARARDVQLFQSDENEYTLGFQHQQGNKRFGVTTGTYDGTTWTETLPLKQRAPEAGRTGLAQYNMAMTYSSSRLAFHFIGTAGQLHSYLASYNEDTGYRFSNARFFDNRARTPVLGILSNAGPHVEYPTHDLTFIHKIASNRHELVHHYAVPPPAPVIVEPGAGSTVLTSVPSLKALIDLDVAEPQSHVRLRWEFATDTSFTTNYMVYEQDEWRLVLNTHLVGSNVLVSDQLPEDFALNQTTWYARAMIVTEYGVVGAATPYVSFVVYNPPAAVAVEPNGGWVIYASTLLVSWNFSDPAPTDNQSAFQVVVTRTDTGVILHDTGKVVSMDEFCSVPIADPTAKDVQIAADVTLWDSDDVPSVVPTRATFEMIDRPTVTVDFPASGEVLTTAIPTITATVGTGGNRTIKNWRVRFMQGAKQITSSDWVNEQLPNGAQITYQPPIEALLNTQAYTIEVMVTDDHDLRSLAVIVPVTTAWTPPATAAGSAVNVTPYNTEGQGWVSITWNDVTRDPDFVGWTVWRLETLLDPLTFAVLEAGEWTQIAEINDIAATYEYRDYTAPSGHQVSYRVEQKVERFGDIVSSIDGPVRTSSPVADSYWLIEPDFFNAFRLGTVTSDSYTDEYEEAEYVVIGRGRHAEQGERIGMTGTLTAQIRNNGGISARQHKKRLEEVRQKRRRLYLRTPYGDLFRVAVGSMQISRIAGVGLSEFIDVTIPYSEVGE